MKKWLKKHLKNEKGLTLVELLAVIVILGIIAAIAVPAIGNIIENSRVKAIKADAQNVLAAANLYFVENAEDEDEKVTVPELITAKFLDDGGSLTDATFVLKAEGGNTIDGDGTTGKTTVTFNGVTSKQITDSKNETTVSGGATGED